MRVGLATNLTFQHGCIDEGRGGVAMRGRRGTWTVFNEHGAHAHTRHVGQLAVKDFRHFDAAAFVSCAATFVDSSKAPASSSKAIFFTVTLLLMRAFGIGSVPNRQSVSVQQ